MRKLVDKMYELLKELKGLVKKVSPYYRVIYNDVLVERFKVVDLINPRSGKVENRPSYEGKIVHAIKECVSKDDTVVILGGGIGIATVHVDRKLRSKGKIHVFEPSKYMMELHRKTTDINNVTSKIEIHNKAVKSIKKSWGKSEDIFIEPVDIPRADVLICDIEGAEAEALPYVKKYNTIIVETHGLYGAPTEKIESILDNKGYNVTNIGVAEPNMWRENLRDDVMILVATKSKK